MILILVALGFVCVIIKSIYGIFMNINEFSGIKQYIIPTYCGFRSQVQTPSDVDEGVARLDRFSQENIDQSLKPSSVFKGLPLMVPSKGNNLTAIFFNQCDKIDPKPTFVSIKNGKFLGIEMDSDETFQEASLPETFHETHSEVEEVKQPSPVKIPRTKKEWREYLIRQLIDSEDKLEPLSDGAISRKMTKNGFRCPRRTVTSIRTRLKIPGSLERAN